MLKIAHPEFEALRKHGEETYPHECCGIMLGRVVRPGEKEVVELMRAGNTRTDSLHNRYHIAPQELVKAQREGRKKDLEIVGFYHSHPDHPAQWSKTDFEEAHWLGCSYVITAVAQGKAEVTNSFLLVGESEEDKFFEHETICHD